MVISGSLKRELIAFALTVLGMFATKNIGDLEAIYMLLEKLTLMVKKEVDRNSGMSQGFVVSDVVHDDVLGVHEKMLEVVKD